MHSEEPVILKQLNISPLLDSPEGWSKGFAAAKGDEPGVVVGPGGNNRNVFAQQFQAEPGRHYTVVARASSATATRSRARIQINWLDSEGDLVSTSIKSFEVTEMQQRVECEVSAPPRTVIGVLYVAPDGEDQVVRYFEMSLFALDVDTSEDRDAAPRFPTNIIHLSDPITFSQYGNLFRGYDDEVIFKEMILHVREYTMVSYDGLLGLLSMVKYCELNKTPGDYVEVGAWKGGCVGLMAQGALRFGSASRRLHAFDSFQGLPQPIADKDFDGFVEPMFNVAHESAQGKLEPINSLVASERDVTELLFEKINYPRQNVVVHKGWFQETIPLAVGNIEEIAILRLDGDFYESYMVALDCLYPKVVKGGFVIIDDWALGGCRKAVVEYFEKREINPYLWSLDCTTRCFQKV
jgi:O-methyltransferase